MMYPQSDDEAAAAGATHDLFFDRNKPPHRLRHPSNDVPLSMAWNKSLSLLVKLIVALSLLVCLINLLLYQILPDSSSVSLLTRVGVILRLVMHPAITLQGRRLHIRPSVSPEAWSAVVEFEGYVLDVQCTEQQLRITVQSAPEGALLLLENDEGVVPVEREKGVRRGDVVLRVGTASGRSRWRGKGRNPWQWSADALPEAKYMPDMGNGHIATVVRSPWVHMNGLYNGNFTASSRARIPSLVGFQLTTSHATSDLVQEEYVLDVEKGIFYETKVYRNPKLTIKRRLYAHRRYDRLLVSEVHISRPKTSSGDVEVLYLGVPNQDQLLSEDLWFEATKTIHSGGTVIRFTDGTNLKPETEDTPFSHLTVAWNGDVTNFTVPSGKSLQLLQIVSTSTKHDDALNALKSALALSAGELYESHIDQWRSFWDEGRIDVDPEENFQLAQALYGAFYYLFSSLPNKEDPINKFIGLSPGGLARGAINKDYSGHVFWDADTWMYPPFLGFHPAQAKLFLKARANMLQPAKQNAILNGYQGAKYPWESAFSGKETSPWRESGEYEVHVTGDIALSLRQLLYASHDKLELIQELNLEEMAVEMAKFWFTRTNCTDGNCHIEMVMGPDEYHFPVNDSAYTNYIAKLALNLPAYISTFTGTVHPDCSKWMDTANKLIILENTLDGRVFHPEFEGFIPGKRHSTDHQKPALVKQADVILLGYPLDMPMNRSIRANDLDIYLNITDVEGPAMTWGMFSVGYLELERHEEADLLFVKNYENIVSPFGVWSENPGGQGALNFLTGMGGFLQAVINGYGGIRLRADELLVHPRPLPGARNWTFSGYKYLGSSLDIACLGADGMMTFRVVAQEPTVPLVLILDSGEAFNLGEQTLKLPLGSGRIRPATIAERIENGAARVAGAVAVGMVGLASGLFR
ncbi:protein-glucosylgalactosylhydroxylysine glucosidase-like [Paramacrobiotus metropolitanus]|uniref:protein-glucosylgalactosylhydroxylysine glucosidase-like n=1 Tax=Paramacrobiotus metropolitanus TaxID=2943436 RepID=UPI002445C673|nr:protein-glucosylgalactosylhydroxylysine glucosidase-like [Paramacrobiotus metropolitanus]